MEYLPVGHLSHFDWPAFGTVPASHAVHSASPGLLADTLPQGVHCWFPASDWNCPAGHSLQYDWLLVSWCFPLGQAAHACALPVSAS